MRQQPPQGDARPGGGGAQASSPAGTHLNQAHHIVNLLFHLGRLGLQHRGAGRGFFTQGWGDASAVAARGGWLTDPLATLVASGEHASPECRSHWLHHRSLDEQQPSGAGGPAAACPGGRGQGTRARLTRVRAMAPSTCTSRSAGDGGLAAPARLRRNTTVSRLPMKWRARGLGVAVAGPTAAVVAGAPERTVAVLAACK